MLLKLVSLLRDRTDVEVNLKDDYGLTPLVLAAHGCHETVVKLLLDRVDVEVNSKRQSGQTPLPEAARERYTGVVKLLIGREDIDVNRISMALHRYLLLLQANSMSWWS